MRGRTGILARELNEQVNPSTYDDGKHQNRVDDGKNHVHKADNNSPDDSPLQELLDGLHFLEPFVVSRSEISLTVEVLESKRHR